jgi:hypothetical protein
MSAGDLIQSFIVDSTNVLQGGVGSDSRLVLIQRSDLAGYTAGGIDQITALTLAANKSGFVYEGIRQSLKPKWERVAAESGQSVFAHEVEYMYFDYGQVAKNNALRKANGRYVAVVENAKQDGNTIEVYGLDVGMEVAEMSRAHQELGGAIKIKLRSAEKEYEAKPPRTFDAGTGVYATNRLAIDALLFLPTIGASGLSITTFVGATPTAFTATGTNFFGGGSNNAVLGMALVNNSTGAVVPWTVTLTVTATTVAGNTPVAPAGNYKVRITTTKGVVFSAQNIIAT